MLIAQAVKKHYGKLQEDLKNSFTKGDNDYPTTLVSAYHIINKFKNWKLPQNTFEATKVAFAQKSKKDSALPAITEEVSRGIISMLRRLKKISPGKPETK